MNTEEFYIKLSDNILKTDTFYNDLNALYSKKPDTISKENLLLIYKRLLESSSIFACSINEKHRNVALSIISEMIENNISNENVQAAIELILMRLGVFPGLRLSIDNMGFADYFNIWNGETTVRLPPALASEILYKELSNKITIENKSTFLTDFQAQILHSLRNKNNISISAPTSAGKSHVLKQYVIECLKNNDRFTVIYIVPTRALIYQVQMDLKKTLRDYGLSDVDVYTSTFEVVGEGKKPYERVIMVLTQERLQSIEGNCDRLNVDLMIVDEAQKVEIKERGIILEDSIQQIIKWNPNSQFVFISPFTDNPEIIGSIFGCPDVKVLRSNFSPVNQNLFLVDVDRNKLHISLFNKELRKKIMTYTSPYPQKIPVPSYKRKSWVAVNLLKDGPTMIYCNNPNQCKETANELHNLLDYKEVDSPVKDVISYLSKYIHKDYFLIDYLKKGVAYHYGSVPASVRKAIENLFESRSLDFVCCTSTLMEGVNFPAKNIILHNPRIDREKMGALDYLNIAGRAGRLMKDFTGNIYAIDIDNWPGYKPHLEDKKHKITSAMETVIDNKKDAIINHLGKYVKTRNNKDVETAVTRFIIKEVKKGNKEFVGQLLERNSDLKERDLNMIIEYVKKIVEELDIPGEVILNNLSLDPRLQNHLYQELLNNHSPPTPIHPNAGRRFSDNIKSILTLTNKCFQRGWSDKQIAMFNIFTCEWASEKTLGEMIKRQIKFKSNNNLTPLNKKEINKIIDEVINIVNNKVRFEIHRDIAAYINILSYINDAYNFNLSMDDKVGYYLEIGASTPTTITMVNNGLPRTTAIILKKYLHPDIQEFKTIQKELLPRESEIKKELPAFMLESLYV